MDYSAMIQNRKSFRAFLNTPVPNTALEELQQYFATDCRKLIPSLNVELRIFGSDVKEKLEGSAGYREFMIGAPCYLVILSEDAEYSVENAGFLAEDLVLKITELGLSSCWLAFGDAQKVKEALELQSDKQVRALIAFGYGQKTSKVVRLNIKNNTKVDIKILQSYYNPKIGIGELVYAGKWGESTGVDELIGDMNSTLWRAFYAASLSPSYLNRQPYGFILDGGTVILVAKPDECTDEFNAKLNLGIVMLHFAGVVAQRLYEVPWVMGAPDKEFGLPAGYHAVASCKVYR